MIAAASVAIIRATKLSLSIKRYQSRGSTLAGDIPRQAGPWYNCDDSKRRFAG
jgi:hypothetical protein